VVPRGDVSALAGALGRWLGDGADLAAASAAARARAERFSEADTYARYEAILTGAPCSR
jgi:hypothetical protein